METNTHINPMLTPELDSNVEYITADAVKEQPPVISSVFRSIFVEIPKEFYQGIRNFFKRYADLYKEGFRYLKYPSLKIEPFATRDYKENVQQTFEFALLVIALLIFLVKVGWIYGQDNLKEFYGNDISQAMIEFIIFVIFAISYFVLVLFSVFTGRLCRKIFKIPIKKNECDILFTYLNNILFIITGSVAFLVRCIVPVVNVSDENGVAYNEVTNGFVLAYALLFGILVFRWAKRFALLNNINASSRIAFQITVLIITVAAYAVSSTAVTFFIWGV